eukprot:TRINITY_DN61531_c0_g1_i1.p2 TRINITY_DN61531_c0_g1~~TRINITY_DN61531_c0_g1_i1.p2  ORF type:complete len:154 (+),score=46.78 TRINITY_DN61531_c0_g1_i1:87-548(+)
MSFFFFKQKTAYEMLRSLVGSEMCIRDRSNFISPFGFTVARAELCRQEYAHAEHPMESAWGLVLDPPEVRGAHLLQFSRREAFVGGVRVVTAVGGALLMRAGEDVSAEMATSHGGKARADAVLWDPQKTRAAFTAVGVRGEDEMVLLLSLIHI